MLQQNVLAKSLDNLKLQNDCLLHLTLQWRWQFRRNVILSVQVLVKAVGVKLHTVISTEIMVLQCDAV